MACKRFAMCAVFFRFIKALNHLLQECEVINDVSHLGLLTLSFQSTGMSHLVLWLTQAGYFNRLVCITVDVKFLQISAFLPPSSFRTEPRPEASQVFTLFGYALRPQWKSVYC